MPLDGKSIVFRTNMVTLESRKFEKRNFRRGQCRY